MFKLNSFVFIFLLSGCAQNKDPEFESIVDALTVGILLEETRSLIPEGTVLRDVYQSGINLTKRGKVPTSAVIPIFVSKMVRKASSVAYRISQAVVRSTPPPIHPPCIAARTGTRHSSMQLNEPCICRTLS